MILNFTSLITVSFGQTYLAGCGRNLYTARGWPRSLLSGGTGLVSKQERQTHPGPFALLFPLPGNTLLPVFRPVLLGHTLKETSPAALYKITTRHPSLFLALFNLYRYDVRDACAYFIPPPLAFEPVKVRAWFLLFISISTMPSIHYMFNKHE